MVLKRFYPALFLAGSIAVLVLACGGSGAPTLTQTVAAQVAAATSAPTATSVPLTNTPAPVPQWRYVNSGWVSPGPEDQVGPLDEEFRVFVITTQAELDDFQQRSNIRVSRGTTTSLGRVDFPNSILVAAYLMWRPVQGDPLSVVGFEFQPAQDGTGGRAEVLMELEDSPQGRERPYLLAPMTMVALERSIFPKGEPIDFVFHLNGERITTLSASFD